MDDDIIKKIQQRYKKSSSRGLQKFFNQNKDIENYCKELLNKQLWFKNTKNVFIAIGHNIFDIVLCKNCHQPLKVENAIYGKHQYCCKTCSDNNPEKLLKQKQTCLKKYGTSTPLLNESCKEKTKKTCQEKFGNDIFAGSDEYKRRLPSPFLLQENHIKGKNTKIKKYGEDYGKVLFQKRRNEVQNINIEKYGVPYLLMNKDILEKTHNTMQEKYGVNNFFASNECNRLKNMKSWNRIQKWNKFVIPLFTFEQYEGKKDKIYKWKCVKCGNQFQSRIYTTGLGEDRLIPRCEYCFHNHSTSIDEKEVVDFIKSIYNGEIVQNSRKIISPYEIDIYLPQKKIAFQFDGLYWHSFKDKNYHLNKTELCEKQGIHLIHIFEDEWINKRNIVEDRIKSILGIDRIRVYARKCKVKEISSFVSNEFLDNNHLQGRDNSKYHYGLFYENELVAVMTFCKPRFNKNYDYELIRFASKIGYQVIGGAGKLLSYFKKYHDGSIVSYADRRYSNGKLYKALGFKLIGKSNPNYWWIKNKIKLNRYQCQKHKLKKLLGDNFDENLSEKQNMIFNGYHILYDCGNLVFRD